MLASEAVSRAGSKLLCQSMYMWTNNYWMYMTSRKCKNNTQ